MYSVLQQIQYVANYNKWFQAFLSLSAKPLARLQNYPEKVGLNRETKDYLFYDVSSHSKVMCLASCHLEKVASSQ